METQLIQSLSSTTENNSNQVPEGENLIPEEKNQSPEEKNQMPEEKNPKLEKKKKPRIEYPTFFLTLEKILRRLQKLSKNSML